MYFLDTDILVGWLRNNKEAKDKIKSISKRKLFTSTINIHELVKGAYLSKNSPENLAKIYMLCGIITILNFNKTTAFVSGKLSAQQKLKGKPIAQNDLIIASIALSNNLTLVTRNKKHFENIPNLEIEVW